MSLSRVKLGFFKSVDDGAVGLAGATLVNLGYRFLAYPNFGILEAAATLALGNFLYGCMVSDASGNDLVRIEASKSILLNIADEQQSRLLGAVAAAGNGDVVSTITEFNELAIPGTQGYQRMRQKIFFAELLLSTLENVVAGSLSFGVLTLLGKSTISYMQLLSTIATGSLTASGVKSFKY